MAHSPRGHRRLLRRWRSSYEYDALRRIKKETRQDNSTVELRYDLAGRMRERDYSDSTTNKFNYAGANRLMTLILS